MCRFILFSRIAQRMPLLRLILRRAFLNQHWFSKAVLGDLNCWNLVSYLSFYLKNKRKNPRKNVFCLSSNPYHINSLNKFRHPFRPTFLPSTPVMSPKFPTKRLLLGVLTVLALYLLWAQNSKTITDAVAHLDFQFDPIERYSLDFKNSWIITATLIVLATYLLASWFF